MYLLSVKTAEKVKPQLGKQALSQKGQNTKVMKREVSYKTKPKLRVPHLVLPPGLGSEDRHAIHLRRLESHLSCPCWTWGDMR